MMFAKLFFEVLLDVTCDLTSLMFIKEGNFDFKDMTRIKTRTFKIVKLDIQDH